MNRDPMNTLPSHLQCVLSLEHSQVVIWIPAVQARQKKNTYCWWSTLGENRYTDADANSEKLQKIPQGSLFNLLNFFHYRQSVSFACCHSTRFPQKLINKNTRQYNYGVCCRFIKNPAVIFSSKSFQTSKTKNDKKIIKVSFYEMLNPLTPKISSVTLLTASTQLLWC